MTVRVLSVDGGGYLGLATAVFIRDIEKHFRVSFSDTFDLFCGTSTGGIIASALAWGMGGWEIADLYKLLGQRVFPAKGPLGRALTSIKSIIRPKYQGAPLLAVLRDTFGERTLGDVRKAEKSLLITSFCTTTGRPRIFKTDHSESLSLHDGYRLYEVAYASCAAPTYFPLAKLPIPEGDGEELFCDGGVVANHPVLLGFAEAISELGARPDEISILSISTPRLDLSEPGVLGRSLQRGLLGWRKTLPSVFLDSGAFIAHELMRRIAASYRPRGPTYERIELQNTAKLPMDSATPQATEILEQIGRCAASENTTRERLSAFFT